MSTVFKKNGLNVIRPKFLDLNFSLWVCRNPVFQKEAEGAQFLATSV